MYALFYPPNPFSSSLTSDFQREFVRWPMCFKLPSTHIIVLKKKSWKKQLHLHKSQLMMAKIVVQTSTTYLRLMLCACMVASSIPDNVFSFPF